MTAGILVEPAPWCPGCGARMALRRPEEGQDWEPFWGCSQFPDCQGTRDIDPETGLAEDFDYDGEL